LSAGCFNNRPELRGRHCNQASCPWMPEVNVEVELSVGRDATLFQPLASPVIRPAVVDLFQSVEQVRPLVRGERKAAGVAVPAGAEFREEAVDGGLVWELDGEYCGGDRRDSLFFAARCQGDRAAGMVRLLKGAGTIPVCKPQRQPALIDDASCRADIVHPC